MAIPAKIFEASNVPTSGYHVVPKTKAPIASTIGIHPGREAEVSRLVAVILVRIPAR